MRLLLPVILAGAAVTAPSSLAATSTVPVLTSDVTLTAPATGYLRVRVTRTFDIRKFDVFKTPPTFGGNAPVGFALLPDRVGSLAPHLIIVRMPTERGPEVVESPTSGTHGGTGAADPLLRAGVYRLFFLTRGGGTVRFRAPGQPVGRQRLTASRRVAWTLRDYTVPTLPTGYAPTQFDATLDFDGKRPGHVFGALWLHADQNAYMRGEGCYFHGWSASDRMIPGCNHGAGPGANERIGPMIDKHDRVWTGAVWDEAPGKVGMRLTYTNAGTVTAGGGMIFFLPQA